MRTDNLKEGKSLGRKVRGKKEKKKKIMEIS